jgi:hypothetical protein
MLDTLNPLNEPVDHRLLKRVSRRQPRSRADSADV